jgi:hypothetical protein
MGHGTFRTKEIRYSPESSLAENAESPGSNTFTTHIPALECTVTLGHERIRDLGYRTRMNDENLSNLGVRTAQIEFTTYTIGHLTTTAGALVQTWFQDLLSDGLGGGNVAAEGTTLSGSTTASSFTLTATTGWAAGAIGWMGTKGDGKGDGQAFVVGSVGPPTTSLVALPGTPASSDVVWAGQQAFHDESTAASLGTKRFLVAYPSSPTAGQQFQILGCQLAGVKFTIPLDGGLPTTRWSYIGTYWAENTETIPSAVAQSSHFTAPAAGGSVTIQNVGTATRTTAVPAEIELDIDLGLAPQIGTGGAGTYQNIVGWQRTKCQPMLRLRVPWTADWAAHWRTANQSLTTKHILVNANTVNGRRFAFHLRDCVPVGNTPIYPVEQNEQRYLDLTFAGRDGTVTSTELTRAAVVVATG